MHDDRNLTVGRVSRALREKVWPAVYGAAVPFEVAAAELPGEPIAPAEAFSLEYVPYEVGTPWGKSWGTTWFRVRGQVPAEWAGGKVEAAVDLGFDPSRTGFQCEALVYSADGRPVKSLNPRSQYFPIPAEAAGGEPLEYYIEAASNPVIQKDVDPVTGGGSPCLPTMEGDISTASTEPQYTSRRFDLAVFESEVHALALDLEVLLELEAELPVGPRKSRILAALDAAIDELNLQDVAASAPAARAQLTEVLDSPAEASAHQISAVGHAHIDSAWLWPIRETVRKVARTTTSMAELIENTDEFIYGMSSAQQYAWMKEHRPEVWERVAAAVKSGRFLPIGGMWVESDVVMPTGESLVRQFSQAQRFFEKEFGIRSKGVWLPDSFGYSPALPQLMHKAGFEWFFTQKISWNQVNVFPHHTFWWEGIDGSRVLSHFPALDTYNSELSGAEVAKATRQFRDHRIASSSIAPTGWGDGGGGTTREMVGKAKRLANLEGSAKVVWEHPDDFFDRARAELAAAAERGADPAVWVGELYLEIHRKTLTSQHKTKQGNRRNEHLLVEAEGWAAAAAIQAGVPYPYEELDRLWQQVLLLQFHDILPGSSIAWVHREAVEQHARITAEAQAVLDRSVAALAGDGSVTLHVNGSLVPQSGIAPLSIGTRTSSAEPVTLEAAGGGWRIANGLVDVQINAAGHITAAIDKATGRNVIAPGREAGVLQMHQDFPNNWDAWDVDKFYRNTGEDLAAVSAMRAELSTDGIARVTVERSFGNSSVTQVYSLAPGDRTLAVDQVTDWHEVEKLLKVAYPLAIAAEHTLAETQYGHVSRVTHTNTSWEAAKFETSMHRYVYAGEPGFGAGLVNDGIYAYDCTREVTPSARIDVGPDVTTNVRLTLLAAPRFPDPFTDQGEQTHRYGLVIGGDVAATNRSALAFARPVRQVTGGAPVAPLVTVDGEGVTLAVVKLADDKSGDLVIRVYEAFGRRVTGVVNIAAAVDKVVTANLIEDVIDEVPVDDSSVGVTLAPFEVRTLRVTLAN